MSDIVITSEFIFNTDFLIYKTGLIPKIVDLDFIIFLPFISTE